MHAGEGGFFTPIDTFIHSGFLELRLRSKEGAVEFIETVLLCGGRITESISPNVLYSSLDIAEPLLLLAEFPGGHSLWLEVVARQFNSPVAADCGDKMVLAGLIRKLGNCLCCPGSEEPSGLGMVVLDSGVRVARSPLLVPAARRPCSYCVVLGRF